MTDINAKTFNSENCNNYVTFSYSGYGGGGTSIELSRFTIINKTKHPLKNIKLYCRANAGVSVYEIAALKSQEEFPMKIVIETLSQDNNSRPVYFDIKIWAEGEIK